MDFQIDPKDLTILVVSIAVIVGLFVWWRLRRRSPDIVQPSQISPVPSGPSAEETKKSRFSESLSSWWGALRNPTVDKAQWERLFIESDLGPQLSHQLLDSLSTAESPEMALKQSLSSILEGSSKDFDRSDIRQRVILVVGVNGAGKTTTVTKLGKFMTSQALSVGVVGADTFRKAAQEQLQRGCEKVGLDFFTILGPETSEGADPSSIIFDGLKKFSDRNIVLIDTSGRLHTKVNLMEELKKMKRVTVKAAPASVLEIWMVVDASLGQNSLLQAKTFHEAMGLSGLILTKMDGLSRGGIIFRLYQELHVPILFLGVGESSSDLEVFNREAFIEELFDHRAGSS